MRDRTERLTNYRSIGSPTNIAISMLIALALIAGCSGSRDADPAANSRIATLSEPARPIPARDRNAALCYWAAMATVSPDLSAAAKKVELPTAGDATDSAPMAPELDRALELIDRQDAAARRRFMIAASRLDRCDFELRYEEGPWALLPHLGPLRDLTRVIRIEAREHARSGRSDDAAELVAALFRLANHLGQDRVLISSLVSVWIAEQAAEESEFLIQSGRLQDQSRRHLAEAIATIDRDDPWRFRAAIENERDVFLGWLMRELRAGPSRQREVLSGLGVADSMIPAGGILPERIDFEECAARAAFADLILAWDLPGDEGRLEVLDREMNSRDLGFAGMMVPELAPAWRRRSALLDRLEKLSGRLEPR